MASIMEMAQSLINDPIGATFTRARFLTAYTPPLELTVAQLKALMGGKEPPPPSPPPDPNAPPPSAIARRVEKSYVEQLQPTLSIESPLFGKYVYAPHGEVDGDDWKANLARLALIAGASFVAYTILVYSIGHRRGQKA